MKRRTFTVILLLLFISFAIQAVQPTLLSVAGVIESTVGGYKFPDGTLQESAAVSPPGCTPITGVPFEIISEGVYCFTSDLKTVATTGYAIDIQSDNVTIEMNGWKLDGWDAGASSLAFGIQATKRKNITLRNGTIRGYGWGIFLSDDEPYTDSWGHLVENMRVVNSFVIGIYVEGRDNIVRRNLVLNTGSSSVEPEIWGMIIHGPRTRVLDNDISHTQANTNGSAFGLIFLGGDHAVVEGNRINTSIGSGTGVGYGIYLDTSLHMLVTGNRISQADEGITFAASTGKFRDNLASNVTTPYPTPTADIIDAGNND